MANAHVPTRIGPSGRFSRRPLITVFLLTLAVFCLVFAVSAATIQTQQSGDWSVGATWSGGLVPSATDTAVVLHNVTVTDTRTIAALNVGPSGVPNTLTVNSGGSLIVTGAATVNGPFTTGNAMLDVPGNFSAGTLSVTTTTPIGIATFRVSNSAVVNGNVSVTGPTPAVSVLQIAGTGNLQVKGNVAATTGTVTVDPTALLNMNGTTGQNLALGSPTIGGSFSVDNPAGVTIASGITVNGTLILTNGRLITGANSVSIPATGVVNRTNGWVDGSLGRTMGGPGTYVFDVGSSAFYMPAQITTAATSGFGLVRAVGSAHPNATGPNVLQGYWAVDSQPPYTLAFRYNPAMVVGSEAAYYSARWDSPSGPWTGFGAVDTVNHAGTATSPTAIADFTAGQAAAVGVPPVVSGFSPPSGPAGTIVTINGSGFLGATGVTFGGIAASVFTVNSDTQITATVPAAAVSGVIGVTTPGGTGQSAAAFCVIDSTISASGPSCAGVTLTANQAGMATYQWFLGATPIGGNTQSIVATTAGNYTVTLTDSTGCSVTSAPVAVNPNPPTPTVTPAPTATFCGSGVLTSSPGLTYQWYIVPIAAGPIPISGETAQTLTVTSSGNYVVGVTDALGCTSLSAQTAVTVTPAPTPTITPSPSAAVCAPATITLDAGAGYATYAWSTGASTQTITVATSGTYTVNVTDSSGCTGTASSTVTVNPAASATITASGPTTFCSPGSVTLAAPAGMASYSWSTGATTPSITVTTSGTYSVTTTNAAGCTATDSRTVTVNAPPPTPSITASGPTTFCSGGSVTLAAPAGYTYLWSSGQTTQSIAVTTSGLYTVTVTDGSGCSTSSAPVTVNVKPLPTVSISGPASACSGQTFTLSAPGSGISSYLWSTGATTPSITVAPRTSTTYTVKVTSVDGCIATASKSVSVSAVPTVTINAPNPVVAGSTNTATASGPAGTYTWTLANGTILSGQGTSSITFSVGPTGSILLTVIVRGSATCAGSDAVSIPIVACGTTAPLLAQPADGATNLNSPVTFSWSAVSGNPSYELWIVANGGGPALAGVTAATSLTVPVPSGTNAWYVVAREGQCPPAASASRSFTVAQAAGCANHAAPVALSPVGGSVISSPVTFHWSGAAEATGYNVIVNVAGKGFKTVGTTSAESLTVPIESGQAEWYVEALFSGCPPLASQHIVFGVREEACGNHPQPMLTSPADGSTVGSPIQFEWTPVEGAAGYRVWMEKGDMLETVGDTVDTKLVATAGAGDWNWYVEALFEGCASTFSSSAVCKVAQGTSCPTNGPSLLSPADAQVSNTAWVTFSWSPVAGPVRYELFLTTGDGSPTLVAKTGETSITREVPRRADLQWFVRAKVSGCPMRDSAVRKLRYEPPPTCPEGRPLLQSPSAADVLISPVTFHWTAVPNARQYKVWVLRPNAEPTLRATLNDSSTTAAIDLGDGTWRAYVEALFDTGCSSAASSETEFRVVPQQAECAKLAQPVIAVPAQITAGVPYTVGWSAVPGATSYLLQEAADPSFAAAQSFSLTTLYATFTHSTAGKYYYRIIATDSRCSPPAQSAYSEVGAVTILPSAAAAGSAQAGETDRVIYSLPIEPSHAGETFTAITTKPWMTVSPTSGLVPTAGMALTVVIDTTGLPLGTNSGEVRLTFSTPGATGRIATHGTTNLSKPLSISLVTPVTPTPRSGPPPDALMVLAVAHADGVNAKFVSDVRISNTSAKTMKYQLTFTPSGEAGITTGRQTTMDVAPGRTVALDDILKSWFATGNESAIGTLEVRPLTDTAAATLNTAIKGLSNFVTFASSRTYNLTANGTYGQFIPAVPYANFVGHPLNDAKPAVLSLQQIAQSNDYRTNLGFVEGSGSPASLLVTVFGPTGNKITDFPVNLAGGQHLQIGAFLAERGIQVNDGRVEVKVTSPAGKVTAYASVVDNNTGDSLLVSPVTVEEGTSNTTYVLPAVAELTGGAHWQTDTRIYNASDSEVKATLTFQSMNAAPAQSAEITIAPREVKQLDRTLPTLFGITNDGGALHVHTEAPSNLIVTARTFKPDTGGGTYGQFMQAVTADQAVALGTRPLQILQVEQSARFHSNIGLAEVTGKAATVEVTAIPPDAKISAVVEVDLAPNQFRQLNSLLAAMGLNDTYNGRVTVKVIRGEGRVAAYASVVDDVTLDPTYIPAQ